ncbi:CSEP0417 putative effector protein [Blumeria hordei DH14]|uniref:CSEP0417 putative effector protein n=1 Tax=Blumeria graminis f. sp. hordei (strain DH14) TaxID=546991 RepID=N1JK19_BLUG1|nr:CSEP0417 putative effector protein [Blumeria hordei DH14]
MKSSHHTLRCQSTLLKAIFFVLLISANASLIIRRMEQPTEPGYYCNNKRYLLKEVEAAREAACRGFSSTSENARRPVVHTEDDNVENLMFEWPLPPSKAQKVKGQGGNFKGNIIFNNSCELKAVIYYNHKSNQYEPCQKVPEVSISTNSGKKQVSKKPSVQCGSLSWEIEEIQQLAFYDFYNSQHKLVEVKYTSDQVDGPWKRGSMMKIVRICNRGKFLQSTRTNNFLKFCKAHEVHFDIVISIKDEVRGIVVKHHIWRYQTMAKDFDKNKNKMSAMEKKPETQIISLVCLYDNIFPLFPPTLIPNVSNSRKRKTLANAR